MTDEGKETQIGCKIPKCPENNANTVHTIHNEVTVFGIPINNGQLKLHDKDAFIEHKAKEWHHPNQANGNGNMKEGHQFDALHGRIYAVL